MAAAFVIRCWSCNSTVELDLSGNQSCSVCEAPLILELPREQFSFILPQKFCSALLASFKWLDPAIIDMVEQAKKAAANVA